MRWPFGITAWATLSVVLFSDSGPLAGLGAAWVVVWLIAVFAALVWAVFAQRQRIAGLCDEIDDQWGVLDDHQAVIDDMAAEVARLEAVIVEAEPGELRLEQVRIVSRRIRNVS